MSKNAFEKWIGQTRTMNCGLKATIIAYRTARDADVRFENGTIRKHITIRHFVTGGISCKLRLKHDEHIGLTKTMNCGMKATIIAYRNKNDIDVQFETGTIRKHLLLDYFYNGSIAETPNLTKNDYIGQTKMMNCGLKATIIAYRNSADIDVRFEDGSIKENTRTDPFNKGLITHPNNILFDTYKISKAAFVFHNKTYFYVTYTENDSEISEVMCIDDMKHKLPELAQ